MAPQITACDPFRRGIEQMFRNADFSGLKLQISEGNLPGELKVAIRSHKICASRILYDLRFPPGQDLSLAFHAASRYFDSNMFLLYNLAR